MPRDLLGTAGADLLQARCTLCHPANNSVSLDINVAPAIPKNTAQNVVAIASTVNPQSYKPSVTRMHVPLFY